MTTKPNDRMGFIAKQSFYNLFSIGIGFLIGAINVLFLYPIYMGDSRQGLVVGLLAISNLIQPFLSFGLQHALIKFYSGFTEKKEQDSLLWFAILFPLLIIIFLWGLYFFFPDTIQELLPISSTSNFPYLKFVLYIAISTAYFELFNSWLRVHLKSVFANFLKELYPRLLIAILIFGFSFKWFDFDQFMHYLLGGYYFRLFLIIGFSFWIHRPKWYWKLPSGWKSILRYSGLIFLAGAAASFILDIDKSMLLSFSREDVAYYSVAVYIAAVIEAPGRALFQILSPVVAQALHVNNKERIRQLLKKSSTNLLLISGGIFLLINLNLNDFYQLIAPEYQVAFLVVQLISFGKLYSMSMGCLNQIISNSQYYHHVLFFSVFSALLAVGLNFYFIPLFGLLGAAYATLIVMMVINTLKIGLIGLKMELHPYSKDTLKIIACVAIIFIVFQPISLTFSPTFNILIKSSAIAIVYSSVVFFLGLLKEVRSYLKKPN